MNLTGLNPNRKWMINPDFLTNLTSPEALGSITHCKKTLKPTHVPIETSYA